MAIRDMFGLGLRVYVRCHHWSINNQQAKPEEGNFHKPANSGTSQVRRA